MEPLGGVLKEILAQLRLQAVLSEAGIPGSLTGVGYEMAIPTGLVDLDRLLGGLPRPSLVALGGPQGTGRTSLAVSIARHVALRLNLTAAIFATRLTRAQFARRFLALEAEVDFGRLDQQFLSQSEIDRLVNALDLLSMAPLYIDDGPNLSGTHIEERASLLRAEHGLDLVVIDEVELANPQESSVGSVSIDDTYIRLLKRVSGELQVTVLALFRAVRARPPGGAHLAALATAPESLVQHADCVLVLRRRAGAQGEDPGILDVSVAKNRDGATGEVALYWDTRTGRIADLGEEPRA